MRNQTLFILNEGKDVGFHDFQKKNIHVDFTTTITNAGPCSAVGGAPDS